MLVSQIVPARKVVVGSGINENRRNTSRAAFGTNQGGWFPRITALQNIWLKLELIFSTFQPSMYVLKRLAVYSAGRAYPYSTFTGGFSAIQVQFTVLLFGILTVRICNILQ